nr:DUF3581 family protein [Reinekea marinisedimentorum]
MAVYLDEFYTQKGNLVSVSPEQASRFAKEVAGDFNPIHNPDAKRFCVPGDLLFSLILAKVGLSQQMSVTFSGMVGRGVDLIFPEKTDGKVDLIDEKGKVYTHVESAGDSTTDSTVIEKLSKEYVAFSGQNFPFVMVPLMRKHQVMFNTKRPLVMYESMSFKLDRVDLAAPTLTLVESSLDIDGKRGEVHFLFDIKDGDEVIGQGDKKLLVGGLMPFDEEQMNAMIEQFTEFKQAYLSNL